MALFSTLNGIMGSGGGFNEVLLGGAANAQVYLSQDGKSYSDVTTTTGSSGIQALDLWISAGTGIRYSNDDGVSWNTGVISGSTPQVIFGSQRAAFDGTTVVFVDNSIPNSPSIIHSTDGINFTQANIGGGGVMKIIGYDAASTNPWVSASTTGSNTLFRKSSDGTTWTTSTTISGSGSAGMTFDGSDWTHTFNSGTSFAESTDGGATWSTFAHGISTSTYSNFGEIVFAQSLYVLTARNDTTNKVTILTSSNRTSWTERTLPGVPATGGQLLALNYSDNLGLFVTVGQDNLGNGLAHYSTDGITWVEASLSVSPTKPLDYIAVRG